MATIFYLGSTYSYVTIKFALQLELVYDLLDSLVYVSTLVGHSVVLNHVYCTFSILFKGFLTWIDLIILDKLDFVIIQAMTWLSLFHDVLNCNAKTATLKMPGIDKLEW